MTASTFSVPIDIPWRRIAFSLDMIDKVACDRQLPPRWRSSIAVFEYEPPVDQQQLDGFIVSYLKVACTITGYQPDGNEIRIRERINRSEWAPYKPVGVDLGDAIDKYYACYGAVLEVVVTPPVADEVSLSDYPYFADFDPKKRELYELVTDTGEIMSRSLDDVGVRLGTTTSQSHEVRDKISAGASISAGPKGGPSASVGIEHSTTDLNQRSTENVRTTDAARENRETLSHTTQLSQMYHQLNSYHLGTNRAAFFVLPRPHVVQSTDPDGTPRTFVDGPRQLEGIQEFMLVVVRPKNQEHICVEAYLETAHRVQTVKPSSVESKSSTLHFPKIDRNATGEVTVKHYSDWQTIEGHAHRTQRYDPPFPGYVVDKDDVRSTQPWGGLQIITENRQGLVNLTIDIQPDYVQVTCAITIRDTPLIESTELNVDSFYELDATIFWKKSAPGEATYEDGILITGRAVCSCGIDLARKASMVPDHRPSVVFEKQLAQSQPMLMGKAMSIHDANRLGATINREMIQSLSSVERYPRGMVDILDSQLISEKLAAYLNSTDNAADTRLADWAGVDKNIKRRVTAYSPLITRSKLLRMPLRQQVESFGLSFAEAVALRRALTDLSAPTGSRPIPERHKSETPELKGLLLGEAIRMLRNLGFGFAGEEVVDSPLPSGVVIGQNPQSGTEVDAELTQVKLQIASGLSVRLPNVINLPLSEAMCKLREAGIKSEPAVEGTISSDSLVSIMEPAPRSWVTPNSRVIIYLSHPSSSNCTV